ncbi:MAG: diguanylate cyclase [Gammaproteobacteria bacterium]|nr:diguanylate cyclase [Gammaproteobacteria bacterium]
MNAAIQNSGIISPAMRISFALVLLTACMLLGADFLGFTPQKNKFLIDSRARVSESLAIQMAVLLPDQDIRKMQRLVRSIVKRNQDILSAGIRLASGKLIFKSAMHDELWGGFSDSASTTTHVFVPILQHGQLWGNIELRFEAIKGETILGLFNRDIFRLIAFTSVIGFVVFMIFMLRTLRQLDPSAVIPERVNAAFDTLAEGVMIVDEKEQIILANKAFCDKIEKSATSLIGIKASELEWKSISSSISGKKLPWKKVIDTRKSTIGIQLMYIISRNKSIKFSMNASPILGDNDKLQGVLITLDDISKLEQHHADLKVVVDKLQKTQFQVQQQNKELTYLATRDPMTGCLNRRSFTERFKSLFQKAGNTGAELACIMVDIDHFKAVNDNFGHATGDEIIIMLAEILKSNTHSEDLVGRYGGEEFCLVLPRISDEVAVKTAERIRLNIIKESARRYESGGPRITASLGISSLCDKPQSPEELNKFADEALYVAKESGRNKAVRWEPSAEETSSADDKPVEKPDQETVTVEQLISQIGILEEIASSTSAELEYNKNYDALTGLPNQVLFYDRMRQAIERGFRNNQLAAVLVIDIEMFNQINTSLGREIGDQLLKQFAALLNQLFRKSDYVSHLDISHFAGDEFTVLLNDFSKQDQVTWVIKRLFDSADEPFEIEGNTIHVRTRVGISLYPTDAGTAEELLSHAMTANKHCKQRPSSPNYRFFDPYMQEISVKHLHLEEELRKAIEQKQWKLLYQPKLDINKGIFTGVEALIRWQHPKRGLLSPYEFIDFAEDRKLIIQIGDWVIEEACKQIINLMSLGLKDCKVAVNFSSVQLVQPDIVKKIFSALEKYDIPPRLFEVEVTETAMIDNIETASESLKRLNMRGIPIAMDDFGTGYSSMSYLRKLPLNSLKIDRSFIKDICSDHNGREIARTIITMAHSLDLKVIAEGVEDQDQLALLTELGCDEIQGYLLSKPVAEDELVKIIVTGFDGRYLPTKGCGKNVLT